ncbi:MAG: SRPBCC family protein [Elusimicrobia bacterium]|nr:SRPBCC family protein [Elusimicrobiota bacterium]
MKEVQGLSASSTVKDPVRAVWTRASDTKAWASFIGAFAGYNLRFRSEILSGPSDPPGMGTELAISRLTGPPVIRCRVAWWDPLKGFTVTAQAGGWLTGYHGTFTLRMSELDDSLTSVDLSMKFVFLNRFVELASLLLPVGALYRRRLQKVLAALSAPG